MKPNTAEFKSIVKEATAILHFSASLTPLNLAEERQRFTQSKTSNPQLRYAEVDRVAVQEVLTQLQAIELPTDSLEEKILSRRLEELKLQAQLLLAKGTDQFSHISARLYEGKFSEKYISAAEGDASYSQEFGALETLSGEETVNKIREYLSSEYQQNDWDVSVSGQGDFYVRVKAGQKKILVNQNMNWDFTDLDCLLAHELDGHILRYLNAQKQELPYLRSPLPFYIKTEEGVATFLGDYCSEHGKLALKHHALKYLAGIHAVTSSFREVFDFLVERGFTDSLAFQRTLRLKRGISDTSLPGCFAKEALYYEGIIDVKEYIDAGKDVRKLFSGKFGLDDLEMLPEPTDVVLPKRLAKYLGKI